jgi:hypothetical protein
MMNAPQPIPISVQKASAETLLAVNFSLIMPDVITEVLSSLFTGKAINELFTGRITSNTVIALLTNTLHWYRLAKSYKRCNTRGSRNQANLE